MFILSEFVLTTVEKPKISRWYKKKVIYNFLGGFAIFNLIKIASNCLINLLSFR